MRNRYPVHVQGENGRVFITLICNSEMAKRSAAWLDTLDLSDPHTVSSQD